MKRGIQRGLAGRLALNVREPRLEDLERERIVADERGRGGGEDVGRGLDRVAVVREPRAMPNGSARVSEAVVVRSSTSRTA